MFRSRRDSRQGDLSKVSLDENGCLRGLTWPQPRLTDSDPRPRRMDVRTRSKLSAQLPGISSLATSSVLLHTFYQACDFQGITWKFSRRWQLSPRRRQIHGLL
eukprot:4305653-Pyramimonas_sp.AAC.1